MLEYISVIIPREVLEEKYFGGFRNFRSSCGERVFCCDRYIARLSFMGPQGVDWFIEEMSRYGLVYIEDGKCVDMAVVDWFSGPCVPCDWLADSVIADGCRSVAHVDDDSTEISKPEYYSSEEYLKECRANARRNRKPSLLGYLGTALGWAVCLASVSFWVFVLLWHLTAWLES
jgi:hypothetical protein